jgi:hypothetical protein
MSTKELNFAYKIRHALNDNLDVLPASTVDRLASARKKAVSLRRQTAAEQVLAASGAGDGIFHFLTQPFSWVNRMGLALPAIVLMVGISVIYQVEEQDRISTTAEIEALVLADELPLSAYADHGFNAYLSKRGS